MGTTLLSSKGQVILPKSVREAHKWPPGTAFSVEDMGDGVLLRPIKSIPPSRLDDIAGCLSAPGPTHTLEEMDAAIETELRARHDRGRY
jgi:AbrB family looped-hinge helix DNA binding protein